MQRIHGPSHTWGKTAIDVNKYLPGTNHSDADIEEEFCKHPARLQFWKKAFPYDGSGVTSRLSTNLSEIADRTLSVMNQTRERQQSSGSSHKARSVASIWHSSLKTLAIFNATHHDISAVAVCNAPNSVGPDLLNVVEGMFCRMTDKVVFPTCKQDPSQLESRDSSCFDLETMTLFENDGGDDILTVQKSEPYQREWRTDGDGWNEIIY